MRPAPERSRAAALAPAVTVLLGDGAAEASTVSSSPACASSPGAFGDVAVETAGAGAQAGEFAATTGTLSRAEL